MLECAGRRSASMPVNRIAPRPHSIRLYHRPMEINRYMVTLADLQRMWITLHQGGVSVVRRQRMRTLIMHLFHMISALVLMPRVTDCPAEPRRGHSTFDDENFRSHFRFRKQDFFRLLAAVGLTNAVSGSPIWLHVGADGTKSVVPSDWSLMVLLKKLATGATYKDIMRVVGGSKTALSNTYLHMLEYLFFKYRDRLADFTYFRDHVSDFIRLMDALSQHLHGIPCPYDGLVGIIDGKLYVTNRPGGAGCVRPNMRDTDAFSGKARRHGLKYQGVTTPIGLAVLEGPKGGPVHDSTMQRLSRIESDLHVLTTERQQADPNASVLCVYGDSAYIETVHVARARSAHTLSYRHCLASVLVSTESRL